MKRGNAAVNSGRHQTKFDGAWHEVLHADQAQPVRRIARGAKHGAAGMGFEPIPWRASEARRRQRWKPKGRDAIGGSMRSTTVRPGIAGDARMP